MSPWIQEPNKIGSSNSSLLTSMYAIYIQSARVGYCHGLHRKDSLKAKKSLKGQKSHIITYILFLAKVYLPSQNVSTLRIKANDIITLKLLVSVMRCYEHVDDNAGVLLEGQCYLSWSSIDTLPPQGIMHSLKYLIADSLHLNIGFFDLLKDNGFSNYKLTP